MLSSSNEYLQALRAGKYLRFLEWPHFIETYYYKDKCTPGADDLLTLLVFDWLNNGYCEEDAKKVALLYAVYEMESKPLRGSLAYSLTSISGALFHCMVYQSFNLQKQFINQAKMSRADIIKFMKQVTASLSEVTFGERFELQQTQFLEWSGTVNEGGVKAACNQISSITAMRYILEDYLSALEYSKLSGDELKISRLSMVQRLAGYLNDQSELTPEVSDEIVVYVNKIREMQPAEFEEDFLKSLSPLTFLDNTWRIMTGFGISFFSILQKPSQELVADQLKPVKV